MKRNFFIKLLVFSCMAAPLVVMYGQHLTENKGGKLYAIGVEYVSGFDEDKTMDIFSLRPSYGTYLFKNLALYGVLDVTYINGHQNFLEDEVEFKIPKECFGLGTSFLFKWNTVHIGRIHLFIAISAGILYTFDSFPENGTNLNFTARPGVGLSIPITKKLQLLLGINRFHLSNGQGYKHPHNLGYNGLGSHISLVMY